MAAAKAAKTSGNKTRETRASAAAYIAQVADPQQRKDCRELVAMMRDITGHPARMWGASIVGFGRYHYRYASGREGDSLLTGFAPRGKELVLYLGPGLDNAALMKTLGKHKAGKGCLYIKRLDDVDRKVLRALVEHSVETMRARYPEGG